MPGGLREVVINFKFRQNRLNGFQDLGVENCHFLYLRPVAYITACTTVQAVIRNVHCVRIKTSPGSVTDTDTEVSIPNTEKYRIPKKKYRKTRREQDVRRYGMV